MAAILQHVTTALCLLVISTSAYCAHSKDVLVNADKLKDTGFQDGRTGTVNVDLNSDGYQDTIEYTFSSTTPPGTCAQSDCMSSLDNSPILTFQIKMHDGKSIDGSYMCTSLGVSKERHNGMKDILCGPKYILRWNGEEYDTD
ncbi:MULTISPECIES: hypothetical protein [Citrobacter]|uniref:hypothetical protein n=1 Tax=Citrobacter TaxID=544 RepID=UPI00114D326F|nr:MULTISPECIES: hypothetical protein [Citrobacter]MBQ4923117.1 hypothetical protein [Citrobacter werkmanii]MBQ4938491.1 hypothetical protein [Citrobacter werkmanii]MBQ4949313.1 hypothetical protein [Citrobacter werkmanii]MBQ4966847.1 hypothetical protein [Citrobacter werkmanii]MDM3297140.1 hypothetical protein [Citrobacter sp. Cc139]